MKKVLAMFLALMMVLSLAACGGGDTQESQGTTTTQPPTTTESVENTPAPVDPEPISYTPLLHLDFETIDGLTAVHQIENDGSVAASATYAIAGSNHPITLAEGQGAVGNALYLDGKYGVDFEMPEIADDVYTISFWYNADRVATFGPVVQIGRNIAWSNEPADTRDRTTTWMNFTKSTWGDNSADIFPVIWNRNTSIGTEVAEGGVNPWIYAMDNLEHGKREWCMVTIVLNGTRYVADDGMDRIETQLYLDGELKWEANSENMYYQGVAPELFKGDNLEGHIGINYWDTTYKGFIDELYIYNNALTAGQVKTLFEEGNPPATPTAPETPDYEDEGGAGGTEPIDPDSLSAAPVDSSAIDTLGTPDRVLAWWTDNSGSYAVVEGQTTTLKLNNYSCAANNWSNFALVLCANEFDTDAFASGEAEVCTVPDYVEYAVQRSDAFGWGPEGYSATYEMSWTDWVAWLNLMTEAKVEVAITREGNVVTFDYTFTGADGTVMTEKAVVTTTAPADGPIYVFVEGEGAYIELLSVE